MRMLSITSSRFLASMARMCAEESMPLARTQRYTATWQRCHDTTHFLYSASTVVLLYFWASFMLLTRSLMSLLSTLCAISTWRCVEPGKAGIRRSTAASSSRSSSPTCTAQSLELQTKVKRRFLKISQSQRRPLLGASPD